MAALRGGRSTWSQRVRRLRPTAPGVGAVRRVAGAAVLGIAAGLLSACSVEDAFSFGWPKGGITPQSHRMFDLWIGSNDRRAGGRLLRLGPDLLVHHPLPQAGRPSCRAQTRYNLPIELIYSVAPFLIVSVLFYYTAVVQTDVNRAPPTRT